MIRIRINRRMLSGMLYYTGLLFLIGVIGRVFRLGSPLYLTGHRVIATRGMNGMPGKIDEVALLATHAVTDVELERRLRFVSRFRPVGDPSELAHGLPRGRAFYLTFDDGYRDNVRAAGPVLKKLRIKAVVFVVAELLRNPRLLPWWDAWCRPSPGSAIGQNTISEYQNRCAEKKRITRGLLRDSAQDCSEVDEPERLYLSMQEAGELHAEGVFYLGNHTLSHANLACLNEDEILSEIAGGLEAIRDLPAYLPLFAYPFGSYDGRVLAQLKSYGGLKIAFATGKGDDRDHLTIRRVNLNSAPFHFFAAECVGLFDFIAWLRNLFNPGRRARLRSPV